MLNIKVSSCPTQKEENITMTQVIFIEVLEGQIIKLNHSDQHQTGSNWIKFDQT